MRLNKLDPNTPLGGVPCAVPNSASLRIVYFWKPTFLPLSRRCRRASGAGESRRGIILIATPPILGWAIKQRIASSVIHKWTELPSHDHSFISGCGPDALLRTRLLVSGQHTCCRNDVRSPGRFFGWLVWYLSWNTNS